MPYSEEHHPASPSIFISSTVKEFRDLRFAMAYIFRRQGYIVSQSEAYDFNVSGNSTAVKECLKNIRNSDYYILLIGNETGYIFENDISITRCEYRVAKESFLETGRPVMHLFLRNETDIALKTNNNNEIPEFDNVPHQRTFIYEVQNPNNERVPNFLKRFDNSESLLNSLEFPLNLGRNLTERLARHSLISELLSNLVQMVERHRSSASVRHFYMEKIRREYPMTKDQLKKDINLPKDLSSYLLFALVGRIHGNDLFTQAIEDAIYRGIFLQYEPHSGTFLDSPVHILLKHILDDIRKLKNLDSENMPRWDLNILVSIERLQTMQTPYLTIKGQDYLWALSYYDQVTNIFNEHKSLCRFLLGVTDKLEEIARQPITPLGAHMANNILKERVSEDEIARLIRNNIFPFGSRIPQDMYGITREEQMDLMKTILKTKLEEAGMKNITDELLKEMSAIALDAGAPPEDGIERRSK